MYYTVTENRIIILKNHTERSVYKLRPNAYYLILIYTYETPTSFETMQNDVL